MGEWATSYHASSVVAPQDSNPSVGVFCGDVFSPKKMRQRYSIAQVGAVIFCGSMFFALKLA